MINFVPQAAGLGANGAPDAALVQAMLARKKAQESLSGGAHLTQAASGTEPIYNKSLGYAKLLAGGVGGYMEGQEANAKQTAAKQGATSAAGIAQSLGLTPQQAQQLQGMYLSDPTAAAAIVKQMTERLFAKPDEKWAQEQRPDGLYQRSATTGKMERVSEAQKPQFGDVGTDKFGNAQKGWIDPSARTITPAPLSGAPQPAASPAGAAPVAGAVPPPSPDMNPVDYYKKQSDNAISGTLPADQAKVSALRQEVQGLPSYKNLAQAAPIYTAMADAASKNTKASDLNLVYGLGKIMDPGSVVREGEMVMVKNAAGLSEQLIGAVNALQGGAALTPDTRIALMREAKGRLDAYKQSFEQDAQQYNDIATRNRMNPADILPQFPKATEFERAGPAIPKTLQSDIAAAAQQAQAAQPAAPQQAPQPAPGGLSIDMIEAEIARRQQAAAAQQDQQRYTDAMGGQY